MSRCARFIHPAFAQCECGQFTVDEVGRMVRECAGLRQRNIEATQALATKDARIVELELEREHWQVRCDQLAAHRNQAVAERDAARAKVREMEGSWIGIHEARAAGYAEGVGAALETLELCDCPIPGCQHDRTADRIRALLPKETP